MDDYPAGPIDTGYWARRELVRALARGAAGTPCEQAGVELLIDAEAWLHRADFIGSFVTVDAGVASMLAFIDWEAAITALEDGRLPCSGGERRILRIAASMSCGIPVDLRDALTSLDATNLELTATAVRNAAGWRPGFWEERA